MSVAASLIITNYNYARYVGPCIESGLQQSVPTEVVVVDDGSTDNSEKEISSFGSSIVFVRTDRVGQAEAINAGIAASKGSVLLLLDSDDLALSNRTEKTLISFDQSPEIDWLRHDIRLIDDAGYTVKESYGYGLGDHNPARDVHARGRTRGTTSGIAVRRSLVERLGPLPSSYRGYADAYLLMAFALAARGETLREVLSEKRVHALHHFTGARYFDTSRAAFHIALRANLARDARRLAETLSSGIDVAHGMTWWQLKAGFDLSKLEGRPDWPLWRAHMAAISVSSLVWRERALLRFRSSLLALDSGKDLSIRVVAHQRGKGSTRP